MRLFLSQSVTPTQHSSLGASSYYRWRACPGSIRQSRGIVSRSSAYAEVGTLAHDVAARFLTGIPVKKDDYEKLTDEDRAAVDVYVNFIDGITSANEGKVDVLIEQRFDLSKFVDGAFGTADCVIYHREENRLVVVDYKHGAGIPVEVENNPQLLYYGLGAMVALGVAPSEIELVIVQPRCHHVNGPIRHWRTSVDRLFDFVDDLIKDAEATKRPDAPLIPGPHCRFCPALPMNCPEVQSRALEETKKIFSKQLDYDPENLKVALDRVGEIEAWCKSVKEFAQTEACQGRIPPGYKLVDKRQARRWGPDVDADLLSKTFGLSLSDLWEVKLKSVAKVEELIRKHPKDERARLESLVSRESTGGQNLVPCQDPRPTRAAQMRDVFEVVKPDLIE